MPADTTPMMQQYNDLHRQHPDCILFFRLGDFYEMFNEDAVLAADILDLTLTTRDKTKDEADRTPMCGVPFHSAEGYIARLVAKGYKVALCEQTEDPALAKGLVKRDVVRIFTPGTVLESSMLQESASNMLCAISIGTGRAGVAFCDVTSSEFFATEVDAASGEAGLTLALESELGRFSPRELLVPPSGLPSSLQDFAQNRLHAALSKSPELTGIFADSVPATFGYTSAAEAGLADYSLAQNALAQLLMYLKQLHMIGGPQPQLRLYDKERFMELDMTARRNMELCEPMNERAPGEKKGTLLWVLDETATAAGARMLRAWIERPLTHNGDIARRQRAVTELVQNTLLRGEIRSTLDALPDMERLISRCAFGTGSPRDMRALAIAAGRLPLILQWLGQAKDSLLTELWGQCDPLTDVQEKIASAIVEDPPAVLRDGGFIREGYHPEADRLRALLGGSKQVLAQLEQTEKERTGIKSLKVGFNKVFGYYIEVSKSYYDQVPAEYIRKQTLASCERFYTPDLKELEGEILSAGDRLLALEQELFAQLREYLTEQAPRIQRTAAALAQVDVLANFAEVAVRYGYCCPHVDNGGHMQIEEGRHPVVERMLRDSLFVPNNTTLSAAEPSAIITGPNMAGKSTYMRQVALIALMAQIGSYVPAKSASMGVVDRIFTRVGASDNLAGGDSTFMVEMKEVADILRFASKRSLIILDEVGRGTSTFDGMSVARAVLEHIHRKIGAKCLFATHYHELTDLEQQLEGVKNYNVAVKKRGDEIVFLRRIVAGGADDSFGVEVAKLAGLPEAVITRAKAILKDLEDGAPVRTPTRRKAKEEGDEGGQISMEALSAMALQSELARLDVNTLTPLEAMNLLYSLHKRAGESQ